MGKKIDDFGSYYKDLLWRGVGYMKMGWKKHSRQRENQLPNLK